MKTNSIHYLLVFLLLILFTTHTDKSYSQSYKSENLFYMVGSMGSYQDFAKHADEISIICPDVYQIDSVGVITGEVDRRILELAQKKDIKVMPLFASFDQRGIHALLTNEAARKEAIRLMLFYAREFHFYGWQFDIENIYFTDKDAYTSFFKQTADSLHKYGFAISSAVVKSDQPAPESANPAYHRFLYESWRGAFDIPAIAAASDFISIMTYDQHTAYTPPGPVAGIPWMKRIVAYLLDSGIPADKISLGIPNYSDYWYPTVSNRGPGSTRDEISYAAAKDLLDRYQAVPEWMGDQQVYFTHWETGGIFNWLFIEDAKSFLPKFKLAQINHLRGISVWVLGSEDPAIWNLLKKEAVTVRVK
ncbi:MAG TPA: glycosyl hydrolase family 18 protein [Hanamia sp.]|nr:glycosyl hydrolase family 18 protein [Hanamia sp.]